MQPFLSSVPSSQPSLPGKPGQPLSFGRCKPGSEQPRFTFWCYHLIIRLLNHSTHKYTLNNNYALGSAPGPGTQQGTSRRIHLHEPSRLLRPRHRWALEGVSNPLQIPKRMHISKGMPNRMPFQRAGRSLTPTGGPLGV